ncbi:MAG: hypothetical protein EBS90_12075, partial [Betaproteobacteria bacterium]|nr:hypothetical protein [Betaproteobacteria bacterium]
EQAARERPPNDYACWYTAHISLELLGQLAAEHGIERVLTLNLRRQHRADLMMTHAAPQDHWLADTVPMVHSADARGLYDRAKAFVLVDQNTGEEKTDRDASNGALFLELLAAKCPPEHAIIVEGLTLIAIDSIVFVKRHNKDRCSDSFI